MIRWRDCDVGEPASVDDEFITHESLGVQPHGTESRMGAFICTLRMLIVLESVVDVPPARHIGDSSPFLIRATSILSGSRRRKDLLEEEAMLDDIHRSIQPYWAHTSETLASDDVIRVTQAVRLHCAEQLVRLFIYRYRFSELVTERTNGNGDEEPSDLEKEATIAAQHSALQIVSANLFIATKGLMTYCESLIRYRKNISHFFTSSRWRACDTSIDSGRTHSNRHPFELKVRKHAASHSSFPRCPTILCWPLASL
jgi:hypothetical protein